MGQPVTVELPDPLQPSSSKDRGGGADDLLAQLAGDEIDRLLAENDVETEPEPADAPTPAGSVTEGSAADGSAGAVADGVSEAAIDDMLVGTAPGTSDASAAPAKRLAAKSRTASAPPPIAATAAAAGGAEVDVLADASLSPTDAAAVDDLLAEQSESVLPKADPDDVPSGTAASHLTPSAPAPVTADAPPEPAAAADASPAAASVTATDPQPLPASEPVAPKTVSAADAVARELDETLGRTSPANAADASLPNVLDEVLAQAATTDDRVPILLRPLQWLNAPFASLSDDARLMLGKVAIITFFNAVAVLVYVMFFRK